jgi:hypothetical protein
MINIKKSKRLIFEDKESHGYQTGGTAGNAEGDSSDHDEARRASSAQGVRFKWVLKRKNEEDDGAGAWMTSYQ